MLTTFRQLSPHLKFKPKIVTIDNLAFKFHYRATFIIFMVCTVLVTSRQYIGEHIRCMTGGAPTIPEHVINTFCFFTTTFTVVRHLNETLLQKSSVPHPGIGPMYEEDPIKVHAYYQWVPFVLFFQGICFYLPHLFWRSWEGGKISKLVEGLQRILLTRYLARDEDYKVSANFTIYSKSTIEKKVSRIKRAFLRQIEINRNWANKFIACETLNFVNLIVQISITNKFLSGQFLNLGIDFIQDDFKGIMDSLDIVFPKVTKCHFYKYGASGSIQKHDALCVMALNVINEKIYVFLWFWFLILLFVSIAALVWRAFSIFMHSRSNRFNGFVFSLACPGRMNPWDMLVVTKEFHFSDWLFLYYIAKNMEPYLFRELLIDIAKEIQSERNSVASRLEDDEESDIENIRDYDEDVNDDDDDDDNHSLNSEDMNRALKPNNNEKRVKFS